LAVCAPFVALLGIGGVAVAQAVDARAGLNAATQAAAAAAARAPDPAAARLAAQAQFEAVVETYPLTGCALRLDLGSFGRNGFARATGIGSIDLGWASLLPFRTGLNMDSIATAPLEPYRTRATAP